MADYVTYARGLESILGGHAVYLIWTTRLHEEIAKTCGLFVYGKLHDADFCEDLALCCSE